MEKLANAFSVLELDADDSHVPTTAGTPFLSSISHSISTLFFHFYFHA